MHYEVEYAGALGDIVAQMWIAGSYNFLANLPDGDTATVTLRSSNPGARELVETLPGFGSTINLVELPFRYPPATESCWRHTHWDHNPTVFPTLKDLAKIDGLVRNFVVFSASAGGSERVVKDTLAEKTIRALLAYLPKDWDIIVVGRSFSLSQEHSVIDHPRVLNFVDQLSVPGTFELLSRSKAVVSSHSAVCIMGWLVGKPQFVLYPKHCFTCPVLNNSVPERNKTLRHWCLYDDFRDYKIGEFVAKIKENPAPQSPAEKIFVAAASRPPLHSLDLKWHSRLKKEAFWWFDHAAANLDWYKDRELDPKLWTGKVLNVGSGPLLRQGVTNVDVLGQFYSGMFKHLGIKTRAPKAVNAERLTSAFDSVFDTVYARNVVDQCRNPDVAISEMLAVTKPGGVVVLRHFVNQAKFSGYQTAATSNFEARGRDVAIWNRSRTIMQWQPSDNVTWTRFQEEGRDGIELRITAQ